MSEKQKWLLVIVLSPIAIPAALVWLYWPMILGQLVQLWYLGIFE